MTDFSKWDKFDVDAAEEEVERKAGAEEATRRRIAEEQRALKSCQDRAARLKSEAVVRALKAKRGSRRRQPAATTASSDNANSSDDPLGEKPKDDPASLARASADEAEAILAGLRGGLALRDEVVAAAESGELHRGVRKARECLAQLDAARVPLLKATASPDDDGSNAQGQAGGGAGSGAGGSTCCGGGGGHSHAHAHSHGGSDACGASGVHSGGACATGSGGAGVGADDAAARALDGRREKEEEGARKEIAGVLEVLRRAKAACRVAEAACLLRGGRAAESTETLRNLLFEDPKCVPAWVARGESFLALDAPLLAGLHFDRALELDGGCAAAAKHKEDLRRSSSDDSPSAAAGGAERDPRGPFEYPSRPLASKSSPPSSAGVLGGVGGGGGGGGCGVGEEKRVAVTGVGSPAPAEDGAIFQPDGKSKTGAVTAAAAVGIASSSRGERGGGGEAGTGSSGGGGGGDDDGIARGGKATAIRRAVAAACESYRAGVVLHQEAFLSSSTENFVRDLELLEVAATEMKTAAASRDHGGEPGNGKRMESAGLSRKDGGGGEELGENGAGGSAAGGGARAKAWPPPPPRAERFDGDAEVVRSMHVGCHLNIAAAFLLRKTDFESAVDHCTRALLIQPGNSRALVRRAQAHQELGFFRLAVEDLEAAEASVSAEVGRARRQGEGAGGERAGAHAEELAEVVRRLEHARWTKVHIGNDKDELPRA